MAKTGKVILTCALTGAIHTPSMSAHLPVTPDQIIEEGVRAAEAGAAILHVHARNPKTGQPDQSVEGFQRILPELSRRSRAVINITTGGSPFMTVAERVEPARHFRPELASLNMGSFNFGLFPMLERYRDFTHQWERQHLESSRNLVFRNTFAEIEEVLSLCAPGDTRFEFECYDVGHLYNLKHFVDRGLVRPPFFIQSVFGLLGGIGAHYEDVATMRRTAERLFGNDYVWSVLGAGAAQMRVGAMAAAMGGNIRVGLEDSLWAGPGKLASSSAEQVRLARSILAGLGLELATPDEARAMLKLKGTSDVGF
ncbi:3-keto-5-aminohexanoate cleavage protein [Bradyrhizobium sp. WSM 1738]|uniref:3-keto-5-aminohexanoate cleavage protein n=1 Tax=Bradyrhizobium hereditatis TaxID=2821405 RepID=UPI001CE38AD8|nr:3-keto-5-aminohexanoate cleavage protein [Bradyrhizobium hereditatis]MCA6115119.1 3-keto-5-aminohexanoate cleavage protein [Bradyrhizobium hereditatis]